MRISDWSSDVCSSDLLHDSAAARLGRELCARSRARTQPEFPHDGRDSHEISPTSLRDRIGSCRSSSSSSRKRPWTPIHACPTPRSEEHTSELQSLMRHSYAVFCLKKNKKNNTNPIHHLN